MAVLWRERRLAPRRTQNTLRRPHPRVQAESAVDRQPVHEWPGRPGCGGLHAAAGGRAKALASHDEDEGYAGGAAGPLYGATEQYVRAAAEVAAEMGVVVADLHSGLRGHGGADWAERLLSDGLHLTEAGQERVYNIIEAA
eukprot:CAMPEP_0181354802 /NCGR_PEP_ID=MMETSP1106-20121128/3554_1 /TAXON_ID=81844 /ORGANISM="Mantoniella antarctica, Strain SL-175" /LENGTH=140 /DNA_ID=CAMNT_0023467487 /DNA_START=250 /DNA_END=670 /DNA_ORIENTATION=-